MAYGASASSAAPTVTNQREPSVFTAQSVSHEFRWTKGTATTVRNTGDTTKYVRKWNCLDFRWMDKKEIAPGDQHRFEDNSANVDDVELRIFFDSSKADRNEDGIEVDAENPATHYPWMSVDWDREDFVIGRTHTWVTDDGAGFWGTRHSDSRNHKEFELHVTNRRSRASAPPKALAPSAVPACRNVPAGPRCMPKRFGGNTHATGTATSAPAGQQVSQAATIPTHEGP